MDDESYFRFQGDEMSEISFFYTQDKENEHATKREIQAQEEVPQEVADVDNDQRERPLGAILPAKTRQHQWRNVPGALYHQPTRSLS